MKTALEQAEKVVEGVLTVPEFDSPAPYRPKDHIHGGEKGEPFITWRECGRKWLKREKPNGEVQVITLYCGDVENCIERCRKWWIDRQMERILNTGATGQLILSITKGEIKGLKAKLARWRLRTGGEYLTFLDAHDFKSARLWLWWRVGRTDTQWNSFPLGGRKGGKKYSISSETFLTTPSEFASAFRQALEQMVGRLWKGAHLVSASKGFIQPLKPVGRAEKALEEVRQEKPPASKLTFWHSFQEFQDGLNELAKTHFLKFPDSRSFKLFIPKVPDTS